MLTACCPASALAEDGDASAAEAVIGTAELATEKTCVLLRNIDRTDVIDDYNILFYMRGSDIYHVRLPNRCAGLRIADSFMYSTSLSVLCELDVIRPLRHFGGRFTPTGACGLGRFRPIMKDEIDMLKNKEVEVDPERGMPEVEELE